MVTKDKRLSPVRITVLRISGTGEDTCFLAILQPLNTRKDMAMLWVTPDDTVLGGCTRFEV